MTEPDFQRQVFLTGEGDAWFRRNSAELTSDVDQFDSAILKVVRTTSSILEIGCADGRRLSRLHTHLGRPVPSVGVDPSNEAISEARNRNPGLQFHVGTADHLGVDGQFGLVVLGFCLYLCDRALLPRIVAETDRVTADGGTLAIIDFDPPGPRRRKFKHHDGVWSYKMDYSELFTAFPQYVLVAKSSMSHHGDSFSDDESERVAVWILRKNTQNGYAEEPDA
jgi:SAM-dependent methyltransferase